MNPNIDPDTINYIKLKEDRKELDEVILTLKRKLRSNWNGEDMSSEQNSLRHLKGEATSLCILRAFLRGKWHLKDQVYCQKEAERLLPYFRRQPQTTGGLGVQNPSMQSR